VAIKSIIRHELTGKAAPLDGFTLAYIEAALWSTNDESTPAGGEALENNYGLEDIADETLAKIISDCAQFQAEHAADIAAGNLSKYDSVEKAGHDFWLTRCGHGCGFWDGDWPEGAGERLTAACEKFGNVDLYVGDDGLIYS